MNKTKEFFQSILNTIGKKAFSTLFKDHNTNGYLRTIVGQGVPGEYLTPTVDDAFSKIIPRACKKNKEKMNRQTKHGEVYTPFSIVCFMLNLCDLKFFNGSTPFFITESFTDYQPIHDYTSDDLDWIGYINELTIEFNTGEGQFTVNRHNVNSPNYEIIDMNLRCGKFDRKAKLVNAHSYSFDSWVKLMRQALQSTYAYDIQADSLVLTRMSMMMSIIDYFQVKFGSKRVLPAYIINEFADIIAWNFFQMDSLTETVPYDKSIPCRIRYWVTGKEVIVSDIRRMNQHLINTQEVWIEV